MNLHPAQQSELDFLKRCVDRLEGERNHADPHPNVENDLFVAREELNTFVVQLRKQGVKI